MEEAALPFPGECTAESAGMLVQVNACLLEFFLPTRELITGLKAMMAPLQAYVNTHPGLAPTKIGLYFDPMQWWDTPKCGGKKRNLFKGLAFFASIDLGLTPEVERKHRKERKKAK